MMLKTRSFRLPRLLTPFFLVGLCGMIIGAWYIYINYFHWTRYGSLGSTSSSTIASVTSQALNFPFPKKIWQTGPSLDVNYEIRPLTASWYRQNPGFRYELLNDHGAEVYVQEQFSMSEKWKQTYEEIQDVILRADLLRLLVMWASGGVYSDLDTKCLVPITEWVDEKYYGKAQVIIGVEVDMSHDMVPIAQRSRFQLCQWTILAMPGSNHVEAIIEYVVGRVKMVAEEKGVSIGELGNHLGVPEVITTTGPVAFTTALLESLSNSLGETITAENVSGLTVPRLVDDVLFLPVNAFAGHQKHSHSGEPELGPLYVEHYFRSSWWKGKSG